MRPYKIGDEAFTISRTARFQNPYLALKEYVSNSLDERTHTDERMRIHILLDKESGRIILTDNGPGMHHRELYAIPEEFGLSKKRHDPTKIGFQQFGLHAYQTFAESCMITTRPLDGSESQYSRIKLFEKGWESLDDIALDDFDPDRRFRHGVEVMIDGIDAKTFEQKFIPKKIAEFLSETYAPLFVREGIRSPEITIKYRGKRGKTAKETEVMAPYYDDPAIHGVQCYLVIDKTIETSYGTIHAHLWMNPNGTNEKIALHIQDVRVIGNLNQNEELMEVINELKGVDTKFQNPFSPKVGKFYGFINVWPHPTNTKGYLTILDPQRMAISDNDRFRDFANHVKADIVPDMCEAIRENARFTSRNRDNEITYKVMNALLKAYDLKHLLELIDWDLVRTEQGITEKKKIGKKLIRDINRTPNPRTDSPREPPKGRLPFKPLHEEFHGPERGLHSILDTGYGLLRVNTAHPDYERRHTNGTDQERERYNAEILAKEISGLEGKLMTDKNPEFPVQTLLQRQQEVFLTIYNSTLKALGIVR
ncbi:MAG: hypothetical protein ABIJ21_06505 [Nanoarchaeota archaeon]